MSTIIVQVTDQSHTLTALHAACDLARDHEDEIVLLKLIPVTHPGWLGTDDWGYLDLTDKDQQALREYQKTAEKWGVEVKIHCLQSISSVGAIVWAVEYLDAQIVFAQLHHSVIPLWHTWQTALLRRHLEKRHCQLYMPNGSAPDWIPTRQASAAHN